MTHLQTISLAPGGLPVLGHTLVLRRDPVGFLASVAGRAGMVRFRVGPKQVILLCDPELTRQLLIDDRTFDKGGLLINRVKELVGDGLATIAHGRHRRHRRLIQPAFHASRLSGYADAMASAVAEVTGRWRDGQVLDVPVDMRRLTMHAAIATLFTGELPPSAVRRTVDDFTIVLDGFARRIGRPQLLNRLPLPDNRDYDRARAGMRQTLYDAIASRRASGADHDDLLATLIAAADERGQPLTDTEILDHAVTFVAAPTETVATVLGWVLNLLAQHPATQDAVRHEVDTVLGGGPADHDALPQLHLTRRVIMEALRLYPTVWLMTRVATVDTRLGGHDIPARTVLAYSPYLIHRSSDLYADPDRFDPDRWDHLPRSHHAFIPFGGGARMCIGRDFALNEFVIALATIAGSWSVESVPGNSAHPRAAVNLTAMGLRLRVIRRDEPRPGGFG
jgi:pentalenene oxygenase